MSSSVDMDIGGTPLAQDGGATWQARKSEATRAAILDAVIDAYIDVGYAKTTLQQISDRTGLSRGAIVHHFPSMQEITRASIGRLHVRRLQAYRKSLAAIASETDFIDAAVESLWDRTADPLFTAYQELSVAARTDKELAVMLRPAQVEYEQQWHESAREYSQAPTDDDERFDLATDLARVLMTGLATSFMAEDTEYRRRRLLNYLKLRVRDILQDGPDQELL